MTTDVKLNLLGGFSLTNGDGSAVRLPAGKGQALLAYLALNPDEAHARGKLAGLLWGDQDEAQARANLSQCLFRLRKALGDDAGGILDADKDSVRLNGDRIAVDALTLRRLAETDPACAAALCAGPLLDSFATRQEGFEAWLKQERTACGRLMESVLTRHAENRLAEQEIEAAIDAARRLVAMDDLNEAAYRLLMRAYVATGRRHAALQLYRNCEEVLRQELDVAPDAATKALYEEIQNFHDDDERKTERHNTGRLSIAVLPFANLSQDLDQEYFADGMADDLITDLSQVSGLVVASRNSSFAYKGKSIKTQEIARDLEVQYLLEGSVRRAGDEVRINAQLIDGLTGMHLWAETFDRAYGNIFMLQDEVTDRIVKALKVALTPEERKQLARRPTTNLEAYDHFLKAEKLRQEPHWLTIEPAFGYYSQALALDPDFLEAHIGHAWASFRAWRLSWYAAIDPLEAKRRMLDSIDKALDIDPANASALALKVEIQIWLLENARALEFAEKAVHLQPDNVQLLLARAFALATLGRIEESRADVVQAEALAKKPSPQDLHRLFELRAMFGDYEETIAHVQRYREKSLPATHMAILPAAVAYTGLGCFDQTRVELEYLQEHWPWASLAWARTLLLHYREDIRSRYIRMQQKAGIPEWPHGFKGDPAQRLKNTDLAALFFNGPVRWNRISPRYSHRTVGHCDGRGNFSLMNRTRSGKEIPVKGQITIENDMLYQKSESTLMGREHGAEVYRNPVGSTKEHTEYFLVSMWGKSYFSLEPAS